MRLGCTTRFGWAGMVLDRDSRLHIGVVPRRAVTIDFNTERVMVRMLQYDASYIPPFRRSLKALGWGYCLRRPFRAVRIARAYKEHQEEIARELWGGEVLP